MKGIGTNLKRFIPYILIISGCIIILTAVFQRLSTIYYQNQFLRDYDKYISELNQQDISQQNRADIGNEDNDGETEMPVTLINPDDVENNRAEDNREALEVIGVLEIPKINVNVAILEGTDDRALRYTVGYYPQTAKPGEKGNMVLLGHRNYVYGKFFNKLDKLEVGDSIIVKRDTYTYTYKVTESFVVAPEDVWVLNQTSDAQITMITCTPIGTYTHRLIVKGVLAEDK